MARKAGYIGTRKAVGLSKCYALASGNVLSEVEKKRIAIYPEVLTAKIKANCYAYGESSENNPQKLVVKLKRTR